MNSPDDLFCPVCKMENQPGAITCTFCKTPLTHHSSGSLATLEVSEPPAHAASNWDFDHSIIGTFRGIILCVEKSPEVLKIEKSEPFILGRNLEKLRGNKGEEIIDLSSYDAYEKGVSRQHLLIYPVEDGYGVADMDSTNGTWLNQRRLLPNRFYTLEAENEIRLGHLLIRLLWSSSNKPQKSPE
jgi:hypothetical protein